MTQAHDAHGSASRDQRARALERLANETFDLVVVGGGITGVGALLDAATRGMRVALVEQEDVAVGTSSRSSRLIHGGLRYLEQYRFGLVREALAERARLLRLAPHLVSLETFLFPLYGKPVWERFFYGSGMLLYDLLGSAKSGRHRHLSRTGALDWAPGLRPEGLRGGLLYHDAMEDDARYALAVLRTALPMGAVAATRVRADSAFHEGGRVAGIRVTDRIGGESFVVRASAVLDATGVWAAQQDRPFGSGDFSILPSRGTHLLIPRERIPSRSGMSIRVPGKVVFLVPWPRHWVAGTTDAPYQGPVDRPAPSSEEVDEILGTLNRAFTLDLSRADVVGAYAGLRPLVAPLDAASTVKLSREHKISVVEPGLVRISGGKYTTYRVMARDAVNTVLGDEARKRRSRTAATPLVGALDEGGRTALAASLVREYGIEPETARTLVGRHGTEAQSVLALGRSRDLLRPLGQDLPFLEADVAWAVESELAYTLDDVLTRRLRLSMELRDRGESIAGRIAAIMGERLGWDEARQAAEVRTYLESARREFDVPADGEDPGRVPAGDSRPLAVPAGGAPTDPPQGDDATR